MLRVHLIPALGQKRLDEITNEDVQSLKHRLRDKSPKAVNNVLTVLNRLLKTAADWEVLDRMPCAIRLLKSSTGSVDFFDFAEFDRLVEGAKKVDWASTSDRVAGRTRRSQVGGDSCPRLVGCELGQTAASG